MKCKRLVGPYADHFCDVCYEKLRCKVPGCQGKLHWESRWTCPSHYEAFGAGAMELSWATQDYANAWAHEPRPVTNAKEANARAKKARAAADESNALRSRLEAVTTELEDANVALAEKTEALSDLRAVAKEATEVARKVWLAMPPEGKLAYFESGSTWLPEWIRGTAAE